MVSKTPTKLAQAAELDSCLNSHRGPDHELVADIEVISGRCANIQRVTNVHHGSVAFELGQTAHVLQLLLLRCRNHFAMPWVICKHNRLEQGGDCQFNGYDRSKKNAIESAMYTTVKQMLDDAKYVTELAADAVDQFDRATSVTRFMRDRTFKRWFEEHTVTLQDTALDFKNFLLDHEICTESLSTLLQHAMERMLAPVETRDCKVMDLEEKTQFDALHSQVKLLFQTTLEIEENRFQSYEQEYERFHEARFRLAKLGVDLSNPKSAGWLMANKKAPPRLSRRCTSPRGAHRKLPRVAARLLCVVTDSAGEIVSSQPRDATFWYFRDIQEPLENNESSTKENSGIIATCQQAQVVCPEETLVEFSKTEIEGSRSFARTSLAVRRWTVLISGGPNPSASPPSQYRDRIIANIEEENPLSFAGEMQRHGSIESTTKSILPNELVYSEEHLNCLGFGTTNGPVQQVIATVGGGALKQSAFDTWNMDKKLAGILESISATCKCSILTLIQECERMKCNPMAFDPTNLRRSYNTQFREVAIVAPAKHANQLQVDECTENDEKVQQPNKVGRRIAWVRMIHAIDAVRIVLKENSDEVLDQLVCKALKVEYVNGVFNDSDGGRLVQHVDEIRHGDLLSAQTAAAKVSPLLTQQVSSNSVENMLPSLLAYCDNPQVTRLILSALQEIVTADEHMGANDVVRVRIQKLGMISLVSSIPKRIQCYTQRILPDDDDECKTTMKLAFDFLNEMVKASPACVDEFTSEHIVESVLQDIGEMVQFPQVLESALELLCSLSSNQRVQMHIAAVFGIEQLVSILPKLPTKKVYSNSQIAGCNTLCKLITNSRCNKSKFLKCGGIRVVAETSTRLPSNPTIYESIGRTFCQLLADDNDSQLDDPSLATTFIAERGCAALIYALKRFTTHETIQYLILSCLAELVQLPESRNEIVVEKSLCELVRTSMENNLCNDSVQWRGCHIACTVSRNIHLTQFTILSQSGLYEQVVDALMKHSHNSKVVPQWGFRFFCDVCERLTTDDHFTSTEVELYSIEQLNDMQSVEGRVLGNSVVTHDTIGKLLTVLENLVHGSSGVEGEKLLFTQLRIGCCAITLLCSIRFISDVYFESLTKHFVQVAMELLDHCQNNVSCCIEIMNMFLMFIKDGDGELRPSAVQIASVALENKFVSQFEAVTAAFVILKPGDSLDETHIKQLDMQVKQLETMCCELLSPKMNEGNESADTVIE